MFSINIYEYISISDADGIGLNFQGGDFKLKETIF